MLKSAYTKIFMLILLSVPPVTLEGKVFSVKDGIEQLVPRLMAGITPPAQNPLAIMAVHNSSGEVSRLGMSITGELQLYFLQKTDFPLVEREFLEKVLEEQALGLSDLSQGGPKIGQLLSARYLLTATLEEEEEHFLLFCKLIEIETGKITAGERVNLRKTPVTIMKYSRILTPDPEYPGKNEILIEFKAPGEEPLSFHRLDLLTAAAAYDEGSGTWSLSLNFTPQGAEKIKDFTSRHIGEKVEIYIDGEMLFAPTIREEIRGGEIVINGIVNREEVKSIEKIINREN